MKIFTYLCAIAIVFIGITFSLLNADIVTINYFLGSATLPVSILVILSAVVGAVIMLFFCFITILRHKASIFSLKRKVESLEKKAQSFAEVQK